MCVPGTGNTNRQQQYTEHAVRRAKAIYALLWNEESGSWFDYDVGTQSQRQNFYPSNLFPLYIKALAPGQDERTVVGRIVSYLEVSIYNIWACNYNYVNYAFSSLILSQF